MLFFCQALFWKWKWNMHARLESHDRAFTYKYMYYWKLNKQQFRLVNSFSLPCSLCGSARPPLSSSFTRITAREHFLLSARHSSSLRAASDSGASGSRWHTLFSHGPLKTAELELNKRGLLNTVREKRNRDNVQIELKVSLKALSVYSFMVSLKERVNRGKREKPALHHSTGFKGTLSARRLLISKRLWHCANSDTVFVVCVW